MVSHTPDLGTAHMNDSELKLSIILGLLVFVAGILDLYRRAI
jgi:hypothetical protein